VSRQLSPLRIGNLEAKTRRSGTDLDGERKRGLRCAGGPTIGFANRCERVAVQGRWAKAAESFHMFGSGIALVLGEAVTGIDGIQSLQARVTMRFGEDGCGSDGDAARVTLDERFLLDENIELHRVNQQIIGNDGELLKGGSHGLAAGLVDIPGVDARGINFGDSPSEGVFADAEGKFGAAIGNEFFGIIQANDATLGVENDGGRDHWAKESAAPGFVNAGDARPAEFARRSLKTGRAETGHFPAAILARGLGQRRK